MANTGFKVISGIQLALNLAALILIIVNYSKKNETENQMFLKNSWKPCQKTRLDALIMFLIE